jgi:hypothetical protein
VSDASKEVGEVDAERSKLDSTGFWQRCIAIRIIDLLQNPQHLQFGMILMRGIFVTERNSGSFFSEGC